MTALRLVLVALYGIAMLLLPAAHRGTSAAGVADMAAYELPDGSRAPICLAGKSVPGDPAKVGDCAACTLTSAPGLGSQTIYEISPPDLAAVRLVVRPESQRVVHVVRLSARPRAPPPAVS
jgi:hypothetical protein